MGNGALAIGPKLPRPSSTLPKLPTSAPQQICQMLGVKQNFVAGAADGITLGRLRRAGFWISFIPRLEQEKIQVSLRSMPILIITEKTSQARDLRAALGDRFGQILPAEGHLLRLAEPHEVEASWKNWACVLLKPHGLCPTKPATEGNKRAKLNAIGGALKRCDQVILATDCGSADRPGNPGALALSWHCPARAPHCSGSQVAATGLRLTQHATDSWTAEQIVECCSWDRNPPRFLVHDRDSCYGTAFDRRVRNIGIAQICTPFRSPRANAIAERWVRSVRTECLDHMFIFNERHLQKVVAEYVGYFNHWRPHRSIGQRAPCAPATPAPSRSAQGRKIIAIPVLGGLHHVYQLAA